MADVLLAFVHEDAARAEALADVFDAAGFSIGDAHASDEELASSPVRIVVWSLAPSIESPSYLSATQRFMDAGDTLIVCLMEPTVSRIGASPVFDLSRWRGRGDDPVLRPLLEVVRRRVVGSRAWEMGQVWIPAQALCVPARRVRLGAPQRAPAQAPVETPTPAVQSLPAAPALQTDLLGDRLDAWVRDAARLAAELRARVAAFVAHVREAWTAAPQRVAAAWRAAWAAAALRRLSELATRLPNPAREGPLPQRAAGPALALGAFVVGVVLTANLQFAPPNTPQQQAMVSAYVAPQQAAAAAPIAFGEAAAMTVTPLAARRSAARAPSLLLSDAVPVMTRLDYVPPPQRSWEPYKEFAAVVETPAAPQPLGFEPIPVKYLTPAEPDAAAPTVSEAAAAELG